MRATEGSLFPLEPASAQALITSVRAITGTIDRICTRGPSGFGRDETSSGLHRGSRRRVPFAGERDDAGAAEGGAGTGAQLVETAIPTPDDDEVLVRVHGASICGTDLHILEWNEWAERRIGDRADDLRPRGGRDRGGGRGRGASPATGRLRRGGDAHRLRALLDVSDGARPHLREPADPGCGHRGRVRRLRRGPGPERVGGRRGHRSRCRLDHGAVRQRGARGVRHGRRRGHRHQRRSRDRVRARSGCSRSASPVPRRVEGDRDRAERLPPAQGRGDGRRRAPRSGPRPTPSRRCSSRRRAPAPRWSWR